MASLKRSSPHNNLFSQIRLNDLIQETMPSVSLLDLFQDLVIQFDAVHAHFSSRVLVVHHPELVCIEPIEFKKSGNIVQDVASFHDVDVD